MFLLPEASAARQASYQPKTPGAYMLIYYEKPTVGSDWQLQEVMSGLQGHPAGRIGEDRGAVCKIQTANIWHLADDIYARCARATLSSPLQSIYVRYTYPTCTLDARSDSIFAIRGFPVSAVPWAECNPPLRPTGPGPYLGTALLEDLEDSRIITLL